MDLSVVMNSLASFIADIRVGGEVLAPLVLVLSGVILYAMVVSRYRNADKRHTHEKETTATTANLAIMDKFVQSRKGLKNASINGSNHHRVEGALNVDTSSKLKKFFNS